MAFGRIELTREADHIAPDGSEVRILCQLAGGSMAHFSLPAGAVSVAVAHHRVEELWFFIAGRGRMWRRLGEHEAVVEVHPGVSISIPAGTRFQFRTDGEETLVAVAATMPPWPGSGEAYVVEGLWEPTG